MKTFLLSLVALAISAPVRAGQSGITYHARIIKPDETALEGKEVQFRLQIRSPGTENCLLYEELQTHDLRNTGGVIAITINDGSGTRLDGGSYNIDQIFANRAPFTLASSKCETGTGTTVWTPNPSDGRRFQVVFREDSSRQWEPLPSAQLNFVPMAIESKQVGGFAATNILRVADASGPALAPILSPVQATELVALTNGSSTQYTKAGQLNGFALPASLNANESIRWNGTAWETFTPAALGAETDPTVKAFAKANLPTCAAGQVLVSDGTSLSCVADATGTSPGDATTSVKGLVVINPTGGLAVAGGTLSLAASGVTAGTYAKVTVDIAGRVTSGSSLVAADIPVLDASKITSGTMTLPVVTSGAVSATSLSSKSIYVWDSDNTNSIQIAAPATGSLTTNYVLTLPSDDGNAGQVLSTDGSGALSWVTGSSGSVTSVAVSMPAIFSVTGGPITSSGTIAATLASQAANTVFAAPDGSSGTPTFRSLASGDIPALDAAKVATGTFAASQIPSLDASKTTTGTFAVARIPALDAAQITSGTFASSLIPALSAAQIPSLDASKITTGTFSPALIPDLDAAKITSGTLALARIPDLDASKIATGTFAAARIADLDASKTTTGTFAVARIPALDASNVATGTFAASQIPALDASKVGTGTFSASQIPALDASKITTGTITNAVRNTSSVGTRSVEVYDSDSTNKVTIVTPATGSLTADYTLTLPVDDGTNGQVLTTNGSGALTWSSAAIGSVTSVDVNLPSIFTMAGGPITAAGTISATLASQAANSFWAAPNGSPGAPTFRAMVAADVPALDAAKITTGTFGSALIPDLDAAKIATGTLAAGRIPDLDAAKIASGTLAAARIPDFDAAKIATGTLAAARIPDLDAAKIATGTLNVARIPDLDAAKTTTGTFAVARIPALDAAQITTGTFASSLIPALGAAQIPALDASKITTGTFAPALIPDLDAAKITTGTFAVARIPDLDAAKTTTGTFAVARIPALDAAQITTGTFASSLIPALGASQIPNLDASKITTGTFAPALIPDLDAAKITSGTIAAARLPSQALLWNVNGSDIYRTSGNVGIGTTAPATKLDVAGAITANVQGTAAGQGGEVRFQELAANGANYAALRVPDALAANYTLTLPIDDGTNGQILTTDGNGVLSWVAAGGSGTVTNVGLALPSIFSVSGGPVTTNGTFTATLASQTQNTFFAAPDGSSGAPTFRAMVAADVPALDAGKITTGTFATALIPALDAAKIATGTFAAAQIPALDASKVTTGTFAQSLIPALSAAQIPALDASKITTGTFTTALIPALDAAKITSGTFAAAQIPTLDAAKITTGTFATAQIPALDAAKITTGTFTAAQIPALDAAKITTGTFTAAQIPTLDAAKIGTGTFTAAQIPDLDAAKITTGTISAARLPSSAGAWTVSGSNVYRSGGYVGIGTTNPAAPLDVTGAVNFTGFISGGNGMGIGSWDNTVYGSTAGSAVSPGALGRFYNTQNADGTYAGLLLDPRNTAGNYQSAYIGAYSTSSTYSPGIAFGARTGNTSYAERMRIDENGNVGVGNTSPGSKLDVKGVITANVQGTAANQGGEMRFQELAANGSHYAALRVPDALAASYTLTLPPGDGNSNQVLTTDGSGGLTWTTPAAATSGTFRADNGSATVPTFSFTGDTNTGMYLNGVDMLSFTTGGTHRVTLNASGYLGIGTTLPTNVLHVIGGATFEGGRVNAAPAGGGAVMFTQGNFGYFATSTNTVGVRIRSNDLTNDTEGLTVISGGNVGVGTTAPGTKLDVAGAITANAQGTGSNQGGEVRFRELAGNGANYAALRVPDALAADYTLTLPTDDGNNGQILSTDGNGVLSWISAGGSGTVTNVGLALPNIFSVSGGPVTSNGTFTATLASQTQNTFWAAPNGSNGAPTFRAMVAADVPVLDTAKITTGSFAMARIPDLDASKTVSGTFATSLIPALDAAKITTGSFAMARIPDLDASKTVSGTFLTARIPDLDAAKITTGSFGISRIPDFDASKTVSGTFLTARIPDLDAAKITTGSFGISRIPDLDASKTVSGTFLTARIPDLDAAKITTGSFGISRIPDFDASKTVSGTFLTARIPDLDAAKITTGSFGISRIPDFDASKTVSGTFLTARIPDLDAAKIATGSFAVARIPDLDAAKIATGSLNVARIPDLDAAKIATGSFAVARIPDLDAAKIATGSFAVARIPDLDAAKIATGSFATARIPALDTSKITSGSFAIARIPDLDAAKVATGTITVPVSTTGMVGTRSLQVFDSDSTNKVTIVTPATGTLTADYTLTLPADDGNSNQVLTTNGSGTLSWTTPSGSSSGTFLAYGGSATTPTHSFINDSNTGMYNPGADNIGFTTNGTERLRIDDAGNVGIGGYSMNEMFYVEETKTTTATGWDETIFGYTKANPVSPSSAQIINGYFAAEFQGGTNSPAAEVNAVIGDATNWNSGTLGKASSFVGPVFQNAGTVNTAKSFEAWAEVNNGSTIVDYRGLDVGAYVNSGTLQYTSGVYINDMPGTLGQFGIYQVGSNDKNYFNGSIGIGTTSPATKLDVQGTIKLGTGTCGATTQGSLQFSGGNIQFCNTSNAWTTLAAGGSGDVVRGGNTQSSGTMIVGTNDAYPLAFETNNTSRMFIDSTGRVGIGLTADVGHDLDIAKNNVTGVTSMRVMSRQTTRGDNGNTSNNYANVMVAAGTGAVIGHLRAEYDSVAGDTVKLISQGAYPVMLAPNHGIALTAVNGGNVGIGTTSPATKLDVNGSIKLGTGTCGATTQGSLQFTSNSIQYCNTSNAWTTLGAGGGDVVRGGNTQSSGTMVVGTNDAFPLAFETNGTSRIFISAAGKVGINVPSPSSDLDVDGQIGVNGNVFLGNGGADYIDLNADATTTGGSIALRNGGTHILTLPTGTDARAGRVGIGTTAPEAKLDVNGSIKIGTGTCAAATQGSLQFSGGNIQYCNTSNVWTTLGGGGGSGDVVRGGNTQASGTMIVGTDDAFPFAFETNNTNRMIITATGNIGIGTSSPAGILDVRAPNAAASTHATNITLKAQSAATSGYSGGSIYLLPGAGVGAGTTGYVAIGTTAPAASWMPAGSLAVAGLVQADSGFLLNDNSAVNWNQGSTAIHGLGNASSSDYMTFTTNSTQRLRIDSSGQIGIGTSSPRGGLDVQNGSIVGKPSTSNGALAIDFTSGNIQHTTANCGSVTLNNMKDGGTYMFIVKGTGVATCAFTAYSGSGTTGPLTVHLPPSHGATTSGKHTIYNIVVSGSDAYFAWTPGY